MPDHVFSAARLRGYRVLQEAGLGDAVELQILDTVIAGRLWLPFSLIEVAFRNVADRAITDAHPQGEDWLIASGRDGDVLVAPDVSGPASLRGRRADGSQDDPIADAAKMARSQLGRDRISRDDLIAHLMFGFWINRCTQALAADPGVSIWDVVAARLTAPLDDSAGLRRRMMKLLRIRNRVAHHEPVLFRTKHMFSKTGIPKAGADLVTSLLGAIPPFLGEVELTVETATAMAPMAARHLSSVYDHVRAVDIAPLEAKLNSERLRLREARDVRVAAQRADAAARRLRDAGSQDRRND